MPVNPWGLTIEQVPAIGSGASLSSSTSQVGRVIIDAGAGINIGATSVDISNTPTVIIGATSQVGIGSTGIVTLGTSTASIGSVSFTGPITLGTSTASIGNILTVGTVSSLSSGLVSINGPVTLGTSTTNSALGVFTVSTGTPIGIGSTGAVSVSGTVGIGSTGAVTVSGTVGIGSTGAVTVSGGTLDALSTGHVIVDSGAVTISNFPSTQAVSATVWGATSDASAIWESDATIAARLRATVTTQRSILRLAEFEQLMNGGRPGEHAPYPSLVTYDRSYTR